MASGGGFGSLDTMNKSLKHNQGLLKKHSAFKKLKDDLPSEKGHVEFKNKMTQEELNELRLKTIREDRRHTIKRVIIIISSIIVMGIVLGLLISGVFSERG